MTTCEPASSGGGVNQDPLFPMSSLPGSRVSRSVTMAARWRKTTPGGSGRQRPRQSGQSAPDGSSSRMCPVCVPADSPLFSVTSLGMDTEPAPARSQLAQWAPHIHESGCSLWPTPAASCLDMDTMERSRFSRNQIRKMRESGEPYEKQTTGMLNPVWIEWLMGFPPGWTDCGDSETP